jgi:tripartite-type tricarboxylate transporter receptor subunit TctC
MSFKIQGLVLLRSTIRAMGIMRSTTRRSFMIGLAGCGVLPAQAQQNWPSKSVTLVHGFPPGGPVDTLSRILAEGFSHQFGQPVLVEAKSGATGTTAAGLVARAAPDGYTLLAVPATFVATAAVFRTLPYRPLEDFTFIGTTAEYPLVLVTNAEGPLRTFADVVRRARSTDGSIQYGTAGAGSLQHLSMELLAKRAGIRMQHIPYRGGAPAITDLLGQRLDLVLDPPTALMPHIAGGKLRALAVTSGERFSALPDVPTTAEAGYPDAVVTGYQGIAGPAALPQPVATRIGSALRAVLADPHIGAEIRKVGNNPAFSSGDQYRSRLAADIARWQTVVTDSNIERI